MSSLTFSDLPSDETFLGGLVGELAVTVLRANGLLLTDDVGENDSYAEFVDPDGVIVGKTCIIESLNPDWEAAHKKIESEMSVVSFEANAGKLAREASLPSTVPCSCSQGVSSAPSSPSSAGLEDRTSTTYVFKIRHSDVRKHVALWFWDEDPFGRDFNGEVRLSIFDLLEGFKRGLSFSSTTLAAPLCPRVKETDKAIKGKKAGELGTAMYRYVFRPSEAPLDEEPFKDALRREPLGCLPSTPLPEGNRHSLLPCAFKITILRCRWLINRDVVGLSDPYVSVLDAMENEVIRTSVIEDTLSPDWSNVQCSGLIHVRSLPESRADIRLQVWDMDTSGSDFLGEVCLPIGQLLSDALKGERHCVAQLQPREHEKDPVVRKHSTFLGAISFTYEYVDAGQIAELEHSPHESTLVPISPALVPRHRPYRLSVEIKGCRYLPNPSALDVPSPYLEVLKWNMLTTDGEMAAPERLFVSDVFERSACPSFRASISVHDVIRNLYDTAEDNDTLHGVVLQFVVKHSNTPRSDRSSGGGVPIASFSANAMQILQRVNASLRNNDRDALENAMCVQMVAPSANVRQGTAPAEEELNREGPGSFGSLFLWASCGAMPPADCPLELCLPTREPSFECVSIYVWGCSKLPNVRSGLAPFVRVYLDAKSSAGETKKGSEVLRTPIASGTDPFFGVCGGVVGSFPLRLRVTAELGKPEEVSELASHLLTFSVVDANPNGDLVLGTVTASLSRLLQMMVASGVAGNSYPAPYVALPIVERRDFEKKRYATSKLDEKADVFGRPRGAKVRVWVSLQ